jgi:hypothetical protein
MRMPHVGPNLRTKAAVTCTVCCGTHLYETSQKCKHLHTPIDCRACNPAALTAHLPPQRCKTLATVVSTDSTHRLCQIFRAATAIGLLNKEVEAPSCERTLLQRHHDLGSHTCVTAATAANLNQQLYS